MAFDLAAVRAELQEELSTLTGWEAYATWPDSPVSPCVIVEPGDCRYHEAMQAGLTVAEFGIAIVVNSVVSDEAQASLDALLSSGTGQSLSVIDLLQGSTLDGTCKQVHVTGYSGYGGVEGPGETRLFGVVVNIEVHCDRK